ncbi:MAG: tyrosine-type recombinase/integrase, partial [Hyphomicrobiales bacterium]|nr:tyrosine-type recombinase/integrase [Hyphomicrobiales bacterium]
LCAHPRGLDRQGRLFRWHKGSRLYTWLDRAFATAGIEVEPRTAFHILRHSYATWMRRYAGLDTKGLVATGAWSDRASADRYEHVVASEEARKADLLPVENRGESVEWNSSVLGPKEINQ